MNKRWSHIFRRVIAILGLAALPVTTFPVRAQIGFVPGALVKTIGTSTLSAFALTDVNGDGKPDLIAVDSSANTVSVYTNPGTGVFTNPAVYHVGADPVSVTAADLFHTGRPALITANYNANTLTVLTNNGFGVYGSNATYSAGSGPTFVTAAEVNGDSNLDLVCANSFNYLGTVSVLTNNGSGGFGSNALYTVASSPVSVTVADIFNTGKPAFITANDYPANSLCIWTNNGSGAYASNATVTIVGSPAAALAVDINHSGRLALAVPSYGSHGIYVFTNNGTGVFSSAILLNAGVTVTAGAAMDLNGDGNVDLVAASNSGNSLTIFTNNGGGIFGSNTTVSVGSYPVQVAAADLNHDGAQDLVALNYFDNSLSVLLNASVYALNIKKSGPNAIVSWPSAWAGWTLQQSTNPAATNWLASTGVLDNGTNKSLTVTANGNLFFRLKQ